MTDEEAQEFVATPWPKGLFIIFAKEGKVSMMGKVIGLTQTKAIFHPWDLMFGGVDEDAVHEAVLAEWDIFHAFDDIWDMEEYYDKNYPMTGNTNEPN
jgi:hypothetical protein